jgi:hypothetical protein
MLQNLSISSPPNNAYQNAEALLSGEQLSHRTNMRVDGH